MKVKLYTLGCKVNQYETQEITEDLLKNGFSVTLNDDEADVFVVNSCTVTAESDRKTRQTVRHLKRNHPDSIVVLTGCMPQAFPQMASELTAADVVIGNKVTLGFGEEAANVLKPAVYAFGLATVGERSVIPDNVQIGRNTAISGVTTAEDYPGGVLESGQVIKAKDGEQA